MEGRESKEGLEKRFNDRVSAAVIEVYRRGKNVTHIKHSETKAEIMCGEEVVYTVVREKQK